MKHRQRKTIEGVYIQHSFPSVDHVDCEAVIIGSE
jgi:hypothetical protein